MSADAAQPAPMTAAEAHAAAASEGLTLVRAENASGFMYVCRVNSVSKPFKAQPDHGGRQTRIERRRPLCAAKQAGQAAGRRRR